MHWLRSCQSGTVLPPAFPHHSRPSSGHALCPGAVTANQGFLTLLGSRPLLLSVSVLVPSYSVSQPWAFPTHFPTSTLYAVHAPSEHGMWAPTMAPNPGMQLARLEHLAVPILPTCTTKYHLWSLCHSLPPCLNSCMSLLQLTYTPHTQLHLCCHQ